ncbi:hypothetical protein [Duganella sp. FT27W]|uniref:hypothetical protein n=1 Tax=Duganella sp. FT27W TaxID=2654636 RepID=UPI00128AECD7|nr:hypothetical protein [Duganella sp. FT27W]MPQ55123.1 hypothetical protein [Duganella sp. FT27W]
MKRRLTALLVAVSAAAGADEQPQQQEAPQVVRQAIAHGHATATIGGLLADESRRRLNATGKLHLAVQRIYLFGQADCARLQLDFTQYDALPPGATQPAPYTWSTQMSVCADGHPPANTARRSK